MAASTRKRSDEFHGGLIHTLDYTEKGIQTILKTVRGWIETPAKGVVRRMDARTKKADLALGAIANKIPRPLDRYR